MKRITLITLIFASMGVIISCDNEADIQVSDTNTTQGKSFNSIYNLNITYKGKTYYGVRTMCDVNGNQVFLDDKFAHIYAKELAKDSDWSISVRDSCNITFYESLSSNLKSNGISIIDGIKPIEANMVKGTTRTSYNNLAEVTLFDDRDYKDRNYTFTLNDSVIYTEVANLKNSPWKFNDKCSSLILTNNMPNDPDKTFKLGYFEYPCSKIDAVFIGYDDKNFSDRTITYVCPPASVRPNPSLPGFNDKMSSFKLFFAQSGQY